jgi:hypothetical protein
MTPSEDSVTARAPVRSAHETSTRGDAQKTMASAIQMKHNPLFCNNYATASTMNRLSGTMSRQNK